MPKNEPMIGFGIAENVASFLLREAFHYAHEAAIIEVASTLYSERISDINPDPSWKIPAIPEQLEDWLESQDEITDKILDPETLGKLSDAWRSSLSDAARSGKKLLKTRRFQSTENMVSHVINLTGCLEASLNRHLYFLRESKQIESFLYKSIDRSELMPKLMFCFKEKIVNKDIDISRIRQLVSFRNSAIHYRIDTPETLKMSTEDLVGIWNQMASIFSLIKGEPTEYYIQELATDFLDKWIL